MTAASATPERSRPGRPPAYGSEVGRLTLYHQSTLFAFKATRMTTSTAEAFAQDRQPRFLPCCDCDFVPRGGKRTYPPVSSVSTRMGVLSIDAHRDLRGLCMALLCHPVSHF